ncbi:TIGR02757 family protein [Helicobacter mustelae]|uniref:TIGR02757 family protein n=1 Tax=Helicobacter mustelae (strain ATCC 43772 / CCUG 25715 / CIP 103759 / LMG 18044 / NCTC 12198 / R85-136P) TaxID=679897 RepID=D3UGU2_HELM1|nr:TIGR02757 family protein [Helicobacter mustelae]CBG39713.1 Putative hypothetical protein [Helicobacter mustelae 12198]SQH71219.1 Protein of uncharacterised function (DUF2400) [Helicobacter mustelae]STP12347.1 Protein of uncharacterised function (DUF2400) [Helicobacter mustelae]
MTLHQKLEYHYHLRNENEDFLTPDPIMVLKEYAEHKHFELIALTCALFSYGNARQIVKFLRALDFDCLDKRTLKHVIFPHYRFQNAHDVQMFFEILQKIGASGGIKAVMLEGYYQAKQSQGQEGILRAIGKCIEKMYAQIKQKPSRGLEHLLGSRGASKSPLKRYNLFLRWMVRKDKIDFGCWREFLPSDLILPLDVHTFMVSRKLGLLERKTCDLKSALLLTDVLKQYDSKDPVKYDFALYRIGQEKILI